MGQFETKLETRSGCILCLLLLHELTLAGLALEHLRPSARGSPLGAEEVVVPSGA
jgi:hypothetical protein